MVLLARVLALTFLGPRPYQATAHDMVDMPCVPSGSADAPPGTQGLGCDIPGGIIQDGCATRAIGASGAELTVVIGLLMARWQASLARLLTLCR